MTIVYIVVALLIFGLLITIHEFGHYIVARLCGVAIGEFSIGMGPKLFQRKMKKHDTLFSLRALPIGGYVSMKGEDEADDDPDSFSSKKVWQRILVVAAGALMNLLLGFLIVFIIVCAFPQKLSTTTIERFDENATSCIESGLEVGDKIVAVGDVPIRNYSQLCSEIAKQGHEPITLTVVRGEEQLVVENVVFPKETTEDGTRVLLDFAVVREDVIATTTVADFDENAKSCSEGGLAVGDTIVKVGSVSVHTYDELSYEIMSQGYRPVDLTVVRDGEKIVLSDVRFHTQIEQGSDFGVIDFFVYGERDPGLGQLLKSAWYRSVSLVKMVWDSVANLITGRYSVESVSSPIGATAMVKDTISQSDMSGLEILSYVLNITAVISINLGVFNLIPFPALDGGRLVFLVIEGIIRRPISREIEGKIHFVGIVLLMLLMVLVVGKDILALIFP